MLRREREPQSGQQAAHILALLKRDRTAINFSNVPHDGKAQACSRFRTVEPYTAAKQPVTIFRADARAIIFNEQFDKRVCVLDGHENAAATIFGGIFNEIAQNFVEVLPLHMGGERLIPCNV